MTTNTQMTTEERSRLAEIMELGTPVGNLSSLEPDVLGERDSLLRKLADEIDLMPLIEKEPALYELGSMVKRKVPNAVRLWLQPRTHVRLHQSPPGQLPMPPQYVGCTQRVFRILNSF